jgi:probable rRNA maturation factor
MIRTLSLLNRQRVRRIDTRLLRQIILHLVDAELGVESFELAIHLVGAREMAKVNWEFLQHEGSTDVITFDHFELVAADVRRLSNKKDGAVPQRSLHGELFVCLDDAVKQAREFRTTWQGELARYVIHGLLHLCGHDDLKPVARRKMKREENRLVRLIAKEFSLSKLARAGQSQIANPRS